MMKVKDKPKGEWKLVRAEGKTAQDFMKDNKDIPKDKGGFVGKSIEWLHNGSGLDKEHGNI